MITELTIENLKGTTRTVQFQPLTIITGRNHAGKSAILDALTVGFLGYLPALGKTNAATFRLASAKAMAVKLETADGRAVERSWTAKGNGVTAKVNGDESLLPSALAVLDPRAFIGANAKARLAMLAHLAGGEALQTLRAKCQAWAPKLELAIPADDADVLAVAGEMRDVAAAIAKNAKDTITMHRGTLQSLAAHDGPAKRVTSEQRAVAQDAIVKASAALQAARQLAAELERKDEAAEDAAAELETFAGLEHDSGKHERLKIELAALMERQRGKSDAANAARVAIAEKKTEIARLEAVIGGRDVKDIGSAVDRAEAATATPAGRDAVIAELCELEQRLGDIGRRMSGLSKTVGDAQAEIEKLEGMECCPVCLASADGWKTNALAYYRRVEAEGNDAFGKLDEERDQLNLQRKELEAKQAALADELALIAALPKNREAMTAAVKLPKLRMSIRALEDDKTESEASARTFGEEIADVRRQIEECEKTAGAIARVCELQAIIAARPADEDITAAMSRAMDAETALETAKAAADELNAAALAAEQSKAMQARIEEAQAAIEKETERQTQFAALKDEIAASLDEAIRGTYSPIIARANAFGQGVITREVAVHDDELGYFGGTGFVPFEAMSGTEQTVVTAAIQAALSEKAGGFLMLDELSRLDTQNKFRFAKNIEAAISAGTLAQAVLVDHDSPAWREFYTVAVDGK